MKSELKYIMFLSAVSIIALACGNYSLAEKPLERPNILFIMSDDHAAHAITAYGGIYDDY